MPKDDGGGRIKPASKNLTYEVADDRSLKSITTEKPMTVEQHRRLNERRVKNRRQIEDRRMEQDIYKKIGS